MSGWSVYSSDRSFFIFSSFSLTLPNRQHLTNQQRKQVRQPTQEILDFISLDPSSCELQEKDEIRHALLSSSLEASHELKVSKPFSFHFYTFFPLLFQFPSVLVPRRKTKTRKSLFYCIHSFLLKKTGDSEGSQRRNVMYLPGSRGGGEGS